MKCRICGKETDFLDANGICKNCLEKAKRYTWQDSHETIAKRKQGIRGIIALIASFAFVVALVWLSLNKLFNSNNPVKTITHSQSVSAQSANQTSNSANDDSSATASADTSSLINQPPSSLPPQQASNGSPYTSPPILGSATTPLTRGLDSGYATSQSLSAPGMAFIGGIRQNADRTSTIDLWVINNTKSDVLGGLMVRMNESDIGNAVGDFYANENEAVAVSTQYLNAGYQENIQIRINSASELNNLPIRIYTQKGTTELVTMTLQLQS